MSDIPISQRTSVDGLPLIPALSLDSKLLVQWNGKSWSIITSSLIQYIRQNVAVQTNGYIGQIIYGLRTSSPPGYQPCNGAIYQNCRLNFPDLFRCFQEGSIIPITFAEYETRLRTGANQLNVSVDGLQVCEMFAYDSQNDRVRFPLINEVHIVPGNYTTKWGTANPPKEPQLDTIPRATGMMGNFYGTEQPAATGPFRSVKQSVTANVHQIVDPRALMQLTYDNSRDQRTSDRVETRRVLIPAYICVSSIESNLAGLDLVSKAEFYEKNQTQDQDAANLRLLLITLQRQLEGEQKSFSYPRVEDMMNALQDPVFVAQLAPGTRFFIDDIGSPDYRWNGTNPVAVDKNSFSMQGYYTRAEIDLILMSYVGKRNGYDLSKNDFSDDLKARTLNAVTPTSLAEQLNPINTSITGIRSSIGNLVTPNVPGSTVTDKFNALDPVTYYIGYTPNTRSINTYNVGDTVSCIAAFTPPSWGFDIANFRYQTSVVGSRFIMKPIHFANEFEENYRYELAYFANPDNQNLWELWCGFRGTATATLSDNLKNYNAGNLLLEKLKGSFLNKKQLQDAFPSWAGPDFTMVLQEVGVYTLTWSIRGTGVNYTNTINIHYENPDLIDLDYNLREWDPYLTTTWFYQFPAGLNRYQTSSVQPSDFPAYFTNLKFGPGSLVNETWTPVASGTSTSIMPAQETYIFEGWSGEMEVIFTNTFGNNNIGMNVVDFMRLSLLDLYNLAMTSVDGLETKQDRLPDGATPLINPLTMKVDDAYLPPIASSNNMSMLGIATCSTELDMVMNARGEFNLRGLVIKPGSMTLNIVDPSKWAYIKDFQEGPYYYVFSEYSFPINDGMTAEEIQNLEKISVSYVPNALRKHATFICQLPSDVQNGPPFVMTDVCEDATIWESVKSSGLFNTDVNWYNETAPTSADSSTLTFKIYKTKDAEASDVIATVEFIASFKPLQWQRLYGMSPMPWGTLINPDTNSLGNPAIEVYLMNVWKTQSEIGGIFIGRVPGNFIWANSVSTFRTVNATYTFPVTIVGESSFFYQQSINKNIDVTTYARYLATFLKIDSNFSTSDMVTESDIQGYGNGNNMFYTTFAAPGLITANVLNMPAFVRRDEANDHLAEFYEDEGYYIIKESRNESQQGPTYLTVANTMSRGGPTQNIEVTSGAQVFVGPNYIDGVLSGDLVQSVNGRTGNIIVQDKLTGFNDAIFVDVLPQDPVAGTLYLIPEEE